MPYYGVQIHYKSTVNIKSIITYDIALCLNTLSQEYFFGVRSFNYFFKS